MRQMKETAEHEWILTSQLSKFDKRFTERKTTSEPDVVTKCCNDEGLDGMGKDEGDEQEEIK